MTVVGGTEQAVRLARAQGDMARALLQRDFAEDPPPHAALANQFLLDALDRGEHHRFVMWPPRRPIGVLYTAHSGTAIPAGHPDAAPALAAAGGDESWRVLVGDAPIGQALVEVTSRGLFRRKPSAREQRFMIAGGDAGRAVPPPAGLRKARFDDLAAVTEFACALHVEDQMGPPIARSGRTVVRERMHESILSSRSWVVTEAGGWIVGKVDAALLSRRWGVQIAGVYIHPDWRGRGMAGAAVGALARRFLDDGLPGVTLHVRADNAAALAAYTTAGFTDVAPWILALR